MAGTQSLKEYNPAWPVLVDKYYAEGSSLRNIYLRHCRSVCRLALEIAEKKRLPLHPGLIEDAAMLHDIGIFLTNAPGIECHGAAPYICHGTLGAELLRKEDVDEEIVSVAERHTGAGLTVADIEAQNLPLPARDYCPHTLLEKLICYADKFYSKSGSMGRKPLESVRRSMERHGVDSLARFDELNRLFG